MKMNLLRDEMHMTAGHDRQRGAVPGREGGVLVWAAGPLQWN